MLCIQIRFHPHETFIFDVLQGRDGVTGPVGPQELRGDGVSIYSSLGFVMVVMYGLGVLW